MEDLACLRTGDGLVDRIAETLIQRILRGEMPPGERLHQDGLAAAFAVSQGTIREAFRRIEALKLAESLPRRGVRVAPLNADGEREIAVMRASLETLAVRSTVGPVNKARLKEIEAILRQGDAAEDLFESEASNRAFHVALATQCRMPRLTAIIAELNLAYSRHVFASAADRPWKPRYNFDHWRIFETYAAGNYDQSATLLARHVRSVDRISHAG
ncbi:MAG: GntR family transcriptional regulator [Sphingomonadales bacterium]|nr:GntR family transcriptional regulator [Sphingomonadales bacterium]